MKRIEVVPYSTDWPGIYEREKARLVEVFKGIHINLYHFGSTSIPQCRAKPKIDILGVTPGVTFSGLERGYKKARGGVKKDNESD